ncbi:probable 2-oxoglutarate-dependent dioxygenase AOP1 [Cornus florida]|uniref:probable 2-oxoglutarate-dependent dioxygenase AOP1 n=1 Tax=Cornus florida TaxID=4283 RepID=UPI002898BF79|nr:probable 2-oxoglutarate-dependent dioxygenase AOP1 [Cornus florida]XP_059633895.1 probable 2-oxoglutarate-dependent dioxygenase AOP1 [Cornus florida]
MGSLAQPKLPVIDFTKENLNPGTSSWFSACNDVQHALEEYGCFIAVYEKVSLELSNEIFCALEELFDLPSETKVLNTSDKPYYGYFGQHPAAMLHESMGIGEATTLEAIQSFANVMWPSGNDHFCELVHSYSKLVSELDQMVTRMVFEGYGVEKFCDSHIGSTTFLLRVMKYRAPQMNETNLGADVHTDKSFITILHQNQVNGLEVKTKDGEWITVDFPPSSFVVMAGDAFLAWSNGRIHSPLHRVIMTANEARYSLGLFAFHKGIIQIPEELVDDKHPLQFKPFDHFGLLHFFVTDVGRQKESTAKAYCGV